MNSYRYDYDGTANPPAPGDWSAAPQVPPEVTREVAAAGASERMKKPCADRAASCYFLMLPSNNQPIFSGETTMDWKAKFQDVLSDLERERDELRVRIHLGKAEARDELAKVDAKLEELRFRAGAARTEAKSAMDEIGEAAGLLADEIKQGFERVRKTL